MIKPITIPLKLATKAMSELIGNQDGWLRVVRLKTMQTTRPVCKVMIQ